MSAFDLEKSLESARRRLGEPAERSGRVPRSDRGRLRIAAPVVRIVAEAASGRERPRMGKMLAAIHSRCEAEGLRPPSRATVYVLLDRLPCPAYRKADLPEAARAALYNLDDRTEVPGHQVAFACFNYGDQRAMCFAAGLPWLAIRQALRLPGWRRMSRGPIEAVAKVRRI